MSGMRERTHAIRTKEDRDKFADIARQCREKRDINAVTDQLVKLSLDSSKNRYDPSQKASCSYKSSK
ncbi:orph-L4 [Microplitis demolitor]|nr:orph-L4 [Microplitis demolitor]